MKSVKFVLFLLAIVFLTAGSPHLNAQSKVPSSSLYMTGRVTTSSSAPARSLWVILYDGARESGRSLTGDDGRYYIGNLQSNKAYNIVVRRQVTSSNLTSHPVSLPANKIFNIKLP
jgi:hypothetical protein